MKETDFLRRVEPEISLDTVDAVAVDVVEEIEDLRVEVDTVDAVDVVEESEDLRVEVDNVDAVDVVDEIEDRRVEASLDDEEKDDLLLL